MHLYASSKYIRNVNFSSIRFTLFNRNQQFPIIYYTSRVLNNGKNSLSETKIEDKPHDVNSECQYHRAIEKSIYCTPLAPPTLSTLFVTFLFVVKLENDTPHRSLLF